MPLNVPKINLEELALDVFKKFIKDPSNKNDNFSRVRIRRILKEFQKEGLESKKIDLTINNLKSANNALDFFAKKNINQNATYFKKKQSYFLNKFFFLNPEEILLRSISMILNNLSGRYYAPRGKKINRLTLLMTSQNKAEKTTLGGCVIEKVYETVIISKE